MNQEPPDFEIIRMNSKKYADSNKQLFVIAQQYAAFHELKIRIQAQLDGTVYVEDKKVLDNLKLLSCYLDEALESLFNNHDKIDFGDLKYVEKPQKDSLASDK